MAITYGGVQLAAVSRRLQELIDAGQSTEDVYEAESPDWPGPGAAMCWPFPPRRRTRDVRIGRLHWPTGASRHAAGHFLATDNQLAQIRKLVYGPAGNRWNPLPLTLSDGRAGATVTTSLYLLPPRPLAQCYDFTATAGRTAMQGLVNGLHLLTLVDVRWLWKDRRAADITVTPGVTTWAGLFAAVAAGLGVTLAVDAIAAAYNTAVGAPTGELTSHYESLPHLLDACCLQVGHRVVRGLDGTCRTQAAAAAKTSHDAQVTRWRRRKGGLFDANDLRRSLLPASLTLAFPVTAGVALTGAWHASTAAVPGGVAGTLALQDAARATSAAGVVTNAAALDALTVQVAKDLAAWAQGRQDQKYVGIVPYAPEALSDSVEWSLREADVSTRVQRGGWFGRVRPRVCCNDCCGTWVKVTGAKTSEIQTITVNATGGYFLITGSGTHIPFNSSALTVQGVVQAVTGSAVIVTGPNGGPYVLTWPDDAPHALLTLDSSHLTGGTHTASIVETAAGTNGRWPGETGYDTESPNPGTITDNSDAIWIREVNGDALTVGKWYRGTSEGPAPDGIPVYATGMTPPYVWPGLEVADTESPTPADITGVSKLVFGGYTTVSGSAPVATVTPAIRVADTFSTDLKPITELAFLGQTTVASGGGGVANVTPAIAIADNFGHTSLHVTGLTFAGATTISGSTVTPAIAVSDTLGNSEPHLTALHFDAGFNVKLSSAGAGAATVIAFPSGNSGDVQYNGGTAFTASDSFTAFVAPNPADGVYVVCGDAYVLAKASTTSAYIVETSYNCPFLGLTAATGVATGLNNTSALLAFNGATCAQLATDVGHGPAFYGADRTGGSGTITRPDGGGVMPGHSFTSGRYAELVTTSASIMMGNFVDGSNYAHLLYDTGFGMTGLEIQTAGGLAAQMADANAGYGFNTNGDYYHAGVQGLTGTIKPGATAAGGIVTGLGSGALPASQGGTGHTSYTAGDLLYASGTTALSALGIGTNGDVLTVVTGLPAWAPPSAGAIGGPISGSTHYDILSIDGSGNLAEISPSTSGYVLTSNGTSAAATFQKSSVIVGNPVSGGSAGDAFYVDLSGNLAVATGGSTGSVLVGGGGSSPSWGLTPYAAGNNANWFSSIPPTDVSAALDRIAAAFAANSLTLP